MYAHLCILVRKNQFPVSSVIPSSGSSATRKLGDERSDEVAAAFEPSGARFELTTDGLTLETR